MKALNLLILFFTFFLGISTTGISQNWLFSNQISGQGDVEVQASVTDSSNNVYLLCRFTDTLDFISQNGSQLDLLSSTGLLDLFLVKYNQSGDFIWVVQAKCPDDIYPGDLILDNGYLYFTGAFKNADAVFGDDTLLNYDNRDAFIAKYSTDGTHIWAKRIAWGTNPENSESITLDQFGNIFVCGNFKTEIIFETDTFIAKGATKDQFIAKFDSSGNFIWAKHYSGTSNNSALLAIEPCINSGFYIGGYFEDSLFIENDTLVSQGISDIILFLTDTTGVVQWIKQSGSIEADRCNAMCSDLQGNAYLTGYFKVTALFDTISVISAGVEDVFIAKYDSLGNAKWVFGNGNETGDIAYDIYTKDDLLYITGYFSDTTIWNNDTLISSGPGDADLFIAIADTSGNIIKAKSAQGNLEDRGQSIVVDNNSDPYISGYFLSDTLFLYNDTLINAGVTKDLFLAKYGCTDITLAFNVTEPSCFGLCDGSATVIPSGGAEPYYYLWDGGQTNNPATGLCAGTYCVTVTDANGCIGTDCVTITQPPLLTASITDTTHLICNSVCIGSATVTPAGGTPPYSSFYIWSDGSTDSTAISLCAGNYCVTVTDANLCTATACVTITEPLPLTIDTIIITELDCYGDCDAAIDITVSGGTLPYAYLWSTGATPEDISNLCDGVYCVTVYDDNGCFDTSCVTITEPPILTSSITDTTHISCFGLCDGSATVTPVGGTTPYAYEWNTVPAQTDSIATGLCAGTYCVTATDANLCTVTACVTITQPAELLLALDSTDATCISCNDGSIDLTVTGGTLPYTYLWSNDSITEDLNSLLPGVYAVTVTDTNLCVAIDSIEVSYLVSINEIADNDEINIYPNPTNGFLYITYAKNIVPKYIKIYNILGENIVSIENPDNSGFNKIDMSAYAEGTYIVKILSDNKEVLRTVVLSTGR